MTCIDCESVRQDFDRIVHVSNASANSTVIYVEQKRIHTREIPHHQVRFLIDLQHLLSERDDDCIAGLLDFSKSYDRVHWNNVFRVPSRMDLGHQFSSCITMMYRNSAARI